MEMATGSETPMAEDGGRLASRLGGGLAVLVSVGLLISLPLRDVGYNALNMWTIVLASVAGWLAIRGGGHRDGVGLGWAMGLLVLAILPALFGWVGLLYLPSLVLVFIGALHFVTRPA
jgi:hypothetical protein